MFLLRYYLVLGEVEPVLQGLIIFQFFSTNTELSYFLLFDRLKYGDFRSEKLPKIPVAILGEFLN